MITKSDTSVVVLIIVNIILLIITSAFARHTEKAIEQINNKFDQFLNEKNKSDSTNQRSVLRDSFVKRSPRTIEKLPSSIIPYWPDQFRLQSEPNRSDPIADMFK